MTIKTKKQMLKKLVDHLSDRTPQAWTRKYDRNTNMSYSTPLSSELTVILTTNPTTNDPHEQHKYLLRVIGGKNNEVTNFEGPHVTKLYGAVEEKVRMYETQKNRKAKSEAFAGLAKVIDSLS